MITIDQRKFDSKEINDQSAIAIGHTVKGYAGKATLSKEVEKIFNKVCQSMELYTAENVPIITEFLEF